MVRPEQAWRDTIQTRGISEVIDSYDVLVVHVDRHGVFAARNREALALRASFTGRQTRLVAHEPPPPTTPTADPEGEA